MLRITAATAQSAAFRDAKLTAAEVVHGDLNLGNVLRNESGITGVIDIEGVGTGCAVFDLLAPVKQAYIWESDLRGARLLQDAAFEQYGVGPVMIAAATHVIDILDHGLEHWPHDVQQVGAKCETWIAELATEI